MPTARVLPSFFPQSRCYARSSVLARAPVCRLRAGPWQPEEDDVIVAAMEALSPGEEPNWVEIASRIPGRVGEARRGGLLNPPTPTPTARPPARRHTPSQPSKCGSGGTITWTRRCARGLSRWRRTLRSSERCGTSARTGSRWRSACQGAARWVRSPAGATSSVLRVPRAAALCGARASSFPSVHAPPFVFGGRTRARIGGTVARGEIGGARGGAHRCRSRPPSVVVSTALPPLVPVQAARGAIGTSESVPSSAVGERLGRAP